MATGTIVVNNISYDLSKLSPDERHRSVRFFLSGCFNCVAIGENFAICENRLRHEAMHEKHRGHEAMHAEMVLILLASLIVSQIVLVYWKNAHFKSFQVKHFTLLFVVKQHINNESLNLT